MIRRLVVLLGALVLLAACSPAPSTAPAAQAGGWQANLDAKAFAGLVAQPGVVVVDVRTPAEYAAGHLENAKLIDIEASDFDAKIGALPKDGTYAVYCRSGNRSSQALARMKAQGVTKVAHLVGGIGAWQASGGKIVT